MSEVISPDRTEEDEAADATVLIVEDENVSRVALTSLLKRSGFRTAAYASAEDALDAMTPADYPVAALIDLDLPGMNGMQLISELQSDRSRVLIAVLITASEDPDIGPFTRLNGVHYLRKPLDFPRLVKLLNRAIPSA